MLAAIAALLCAIPPDAGSGGSFGAGFTAQGNQIAPRQLQRRQSEVAVSLKRTLPRRTLAKRSLS